MCLPKICSFTVFMTQAGFVFSSSLVHLLTCSVKTNPKRKSISLGYRLGKQVRKHFHVVSLPKHARRAVFSDCITVRYKERLSPVRASVQHVGLMFVYTAMVNVLTRDDTIPLFFLF